MDYTRHSTNHKVTPQTKKVPGVKKQRRNNAGGVSFEISIWDKLMRFLILGTEGGTYYVSEKKLTKDACKNVQKCITTDGIKTVNMIVDISQAGRSVDNDAAIFALAMCASASENVVRSYALNNLHKVCRIGTHLFHFVKFVKTMRGFGRGLRDALAKWYTEKPIDKLAYQMLKYQGRDGWTHKDVLRLAHPFPKTGDMSRLFAYATDNATKIPNVSEYAEGMQKIKHVESYADAAQIIYDFNLTREAVPTQFLNSVSVWEALLERMPVIALVRNLGKMSSLEMHQPFSKSVKKTVDKLTDEEVIKRSRIHPISIINAMVTYRTGTGFKGNLSWEVNQKIVNALENAFYMSFDNVEPTGKRIMLALDVSGSMTVRLNNSIMTCREASAVLSMVTMKAEQNTEIVGFTGDGANSKSFSSSRGWFGQDVISMLPISSNQNLSNVISAISNLDFGTTDCALPMIYCKERNIDVDAIVIYTDSETWSGNIHPWQALDQLEQKLGHRVKLIVVGMVSTGFSIAKPDYSNMMDVVGFDTNTPSAISEFIKL